jgi:hypothetical protein
LLKADLIFERTSILSISSSIYIFISNHIMILTTSNDNCYYATNDDCCSRKTAAVEPSQSQQQPQHSVVRFAADEHVVEVMARQDYTAQEAQACWYTAQDYKTFKKAAVVTLKLNRAGKLNDSTAEQHCMRGLECRTREGMASKKAVKQESRTTVLQAQANGENIAKAYQAISVKEQYRATVQGMCDELEARGMSHLAKVVLANHQRTVAGAGTIKTSSPPGNSNNTTVLQGILDHSSLKVVGGPAA